MATITANHTSHYCDAGTQTKWKGLTRGPEVRPEAFFSLPANTPTPPDDSMITEKPQFLLQVDGFNSTPSHAPSLSEESSATSALSLLERRRNPSGIVPHIDMPVDSLPVDELAVVDASIADELAVLDDEVLPSPPPTHALISPLPPINTLHAGHTPPIPDLSQLLDEVDPMAQQVPDEESRSATPQRDISLTGPLSLPLHPTDGADDTIGLDALDNVLAKIAQEQEMFSPRDVSESSYSSAPSHTEATNSDWSSRKNSASSTRSSEIEPVDGVILKCPPLNFGAPIGQI